MHEFNYFKQQHSNERSEVCNYYLDFLFAVPTFSPIFFFFAIQKHETPILLHFIIIEYIFKSVESAIVILSVEIFFIQISNYVLLILFKRKGNFLYFLSDMFTKCDVGSCTISS